MKGGGSSSKSASEEYKKGLWTVEEDKILMDYIKVHGKGKWNRVAKFTGLKRCGKSCRLRWMNYLSPGVKRDNFSEEEDDLIIRLHKLLGNRWSLIAGRVPGRTDNQVKNHWNTHLSKKLGIKKEKCKVTLNHNSDDKATCRNVAAGYGGSQDAVEVASARGLLPMGDCDWDIWDHNSFLFLNDEYPNLYTPNLMEFVDESLDFLCDF